MVNDALTNDALENVTATILRLDDGEEQVAHKSWILLQLSSQVIAEGAFPDSNGELTVSLLAAGHYEVQVILSYGNVSFNLSHLSGVWSRLCEHQEVNWSDMFSVRLFTLCSFYHGPSFSRLNLVRNCLLE